MRAKIFLLVVGDIAALYLSLFFMLFLRYGSAYHEQFTDAHAVPFAIVFIIWILIFFIAGLYDLARLHNSLDFFKALSLSIFVNALVTIAFFYLIPAFGITPKTNLFLFIFIFTVVELVWRRSFNKRVRLGAPPHRVLLIGESITAQETHKHAGDHPQLGYGIVHWIKKDMTDAASEHIADLAARHRVNLIVVPRHFKKDSRVTKLLYELLGLGIEIQDLVSFHELIFHKIPLRDIEEEWFIEHRLGENKFYDQLKRGLEFIFAFLLGIILLPLMFSIALLIKLTSRGPVLYGQTRVGKQGKEFKLCKFRSMYREAEQHGAQWSQANDPRVTPLGRVLRYSHLDELPQLWNVMRGDLSFVGPRPERPEFRTMLREHIPYYEIRHLVDPGITGWAQINYRYGSSIEDAAEKLTYDIYYLKNRSLILDIAILLKTLKSFFVRHV